MKKRTVKPEFVDVIPDDIKEGVLYISIPYDTAIHKCACGCSEIVVTPIKPTDWSLTWNGDTISLSPSIGNWSLPCRSHYFIQNNRIVWSRKWSDWEVNEGREMDKKNKVQYYKKFKIFRKK